MKLYFLTFVVGGVLGVGYDLIHAYCGVLSYAKSHFLGQSLWVGPLFGSYAIVALWILQRIKTKIELTHPTFHRIAYDAFLLFLAHGVDGFFVGNNVLTAVGLLLVCLFSIAVHREKMELLGYMILSVVGPLGEALLIQTGFFQYTYGYPIPYWLPLLWFVAAPLFINTLSYLIRRVR